MNARAVVLCVLLAVMLVRASAQVPGAGDRAALGDPATAALASARVLAAGSAAVPGLRALLADVDAPGALTAVYLLGRLGAEARTAVPELKACLARGSLAVRNQAVWALGEVAARCRDRDLCRECWTWLDVQVTSDLDGFLVDAAFERLRIGRGQVRALDANLYHRYADRVYVHGAPGVLAARARAVAANELEPSADEWRDLTELLQRAVARSDWPWTEDRALAQAGGELAAMFVARGREVDRDVAFGLLRHWDADLRRRGLAAIDDAALAPAWLRAVVDLLWDRDASVQREALARIERLGARALSALAPLRLWQQSGGAFGAACGRAADVVLAAAAGGDDAVAAELREIDEALAGRLQPQQGRTFSATARAALAAVVYGSRGVAPTALQALAELAGVRGAFDRELVCALLHLLDADDAIGRDGALAVLQRCGRTVLDLEPQADELLRAAAGMGEASGFGCELAAQWRAGSDATIAELCNELEHGDVRVCVRAMAELDARSAWQLPFVQRAIATWIEPPPPAEGFPHYAWLLLLQANGGRRGEDVQAESYVARALACRACGAPVPELPTDDVATTTLAAELGLDLAREPSAVQRAAAFAAIEARLRERLGVQPRGARVGSGR